MKKILFAVSMLAVMASCSKIAEPVSREFSINTVGETETKTQMTSGGALSWVYSDVLSVFHKPASTGNDVSDGKFSTSAGSLGTFTGTLGSSLDAGDSYTWLAVYPYKEQLTLPSNPANVYYYIGGRSDQTQTQNGNNNMDHLDGSYYPMYGVASTSGTETPTIVMKNISSFLKIEVTNGLSEAIKVTDITFTAPAGTNIVGQFLFDFSSGQPVITDGGYVGNAASLKVNSGAYIPVGGKADFYMGIKPFTASVGSEISVSVSASSTTGGGTHSKSLTITGTPAEFLGGKIKTLNVNYNTALTPIASTTYTKVTSLSGIVSGEYIIMNGDYLMSNATNTSSGPAALLASTYVTLSADKSTMTTTSEDVTWTFTGTNTAMTITQAGGTSKLYATNNTNGVRVGNTSDTWSFEVNGTGFSMKEANNNRYCAKYTGGSDWRSYGSADHGNYADGGILYLYKKN